MAETAVRLTKDEACRGPPPREYCGLRLMRSFPPGPLASMTGYSINPVDRHVGARLRMRRETLQMSLEQLADALGEPLKRVADYEDGAVHLDAERLFRVCRVVCTDVSFFFEGLSGPLPIRRKPQLRLLRNAVARD